jgi:hypothetical protein
MTHSAYTLRLLSLFALFLYLSVLSFGQSQPPAQEPPMDCQKGEGYRSFDFWIGEWEVRDPQGQHVGDSRVEAILNGCVLLENWKSVRGGEGKSFNTFNPVTKNWRQFWVDASGSVIDYSRGSAAEGSLHFEGEQLTARGARLLSRMDFNLLDGDRVRQRIERSSDGGKTWSVWFEGIYHRKPKPAGAEKGEAPPSRPS